MNLFGIEIIDLVVLAIYFLAVLYLGVVVGGKQTKTLGDFFVAGGKWGPLVSFIFVFASAIAGNEAVVVSGRAYHSGMSGVWLWWSFLFATPVYFLFSTYFRRARVYSVAEFLEMRYGQRVAGLYSLVAGVICILFIGMFVRAIGVLLDGYTGGDNFAIWVWTISIIVAAYVCSGGMMSALLTDLLQGVMCLVILGFVMLPFVWNAAGGYEALRGLPKETWNFVESWDFTSGGMSIGYIIALNLSALVGGIAAPWIYNWMSISKDEKSATQCAWGHLWKRLVTLIFALYGVFFAMLHPGLIGVESEAAWGLVMRDVLPVGWGLSGLMIASFFAAAMSSADTYAATSSAMFIDFIYRRLALPGRSRDHYLMMARIWAVVSVLVAAASTHFVTSIKDYVELSLSLLCFLGVPIYFSVVWRKSSERGMWLSLIAGIATYLMVHIQPIGEGEIFPSSEQAFIAKVFISTLASIIGMGIGSFVWPETDEVKLRRFYTILNTPIGSEQRLLDAGISVPTLVDAGLIDEGPEQLNHRVLDELYEADSQQKMFGPTSNIEIRRERLPWYTRGFIAVTMGCAILVVGTWLATRILFVWT